MKLDAAGAARGIEEKIAQPLKLDTGRGRAGDRRDRDLEDVARGARGVGREGLRPARLRAGRLRRRGPAARLRDRARAAHPDRDRAAVPVALLGARHAARRRAPRLHPHVLFRSRQRRLRPIWSRSTTRCVADAQDEPAPQPRRRRSRSSSTCAMSGQEFTLSVPVTLGAAQGAATARRSAPRSTRSTSTATRTIRRRSRSRWSTSGSARSASGRSSRFPRLGSGAARRSLRAEREVYFARRQASRCAARSISASSSARARAIAGPALIQEHGTTTVLFENDACKVAPSGELIIKVGGA